MQPSARVATIIIIVFFIFFNALQIYLILDRVTEARSNFGNASSAALMSALSEYHKLKSIDSAATPGHALIAYGKEKISLTREDSLSLRMQASAAIITDSVEPVFIEMILNSAANRSIDMQLFERLFQKALLAKRVQAAYRLDTIMMKEKKFDRNYLMETWTRKKSREFPYSTNPMRMPNNSGISVFAQLKPDPGFMRKNLLWPLLAFGALLLIGNTALLFVYRTIRKQKKVNELKTDFINNITHEMKTPITIASAGLQALEHHVQPTERTSFYLHTSKRQLHLLNDFVERILEAAVSDVSDFNLKKERIDLNALLGELVKSHSVINEKPVSFSLRDQGPVYIHGDRLHLETAFHNIIDNAIKYADGSVDINIDIEESSRDCTISIRDNGKGIEPQYIRNIFEKFFRVPQGDAQPVKGFGLGLYYVSSIVKKHSGSISVQSKPGEGTTFLITLPKQP